MHVIENAPRKGNLVATVCAARRPRANPSCSWRTSMWLRRIRKIGTCRPSNSLSKTVYYYGRGTIDDKDEAAIAVANLIRFKQQGFVPTRDIIIALTADEEGGEHNGVVYLLEQHRNLVDAAFCD